MTPAEQLIASLKALCEREGGHEVVADVAKVSAANLRQIINGTKLPSGKARGVGRDLAEKIEKKYPGWTNLQHLPAGGKPRGAAVAHLLSHPAEPDAPMIPWEKIVSGYLPVVFRVTMTDDSMAPWLLEGDIVKFRADAKPVRGQPVLVADGAGRPYVRIYRQRNADHWTAAPLHDAFEPMDSERDQLQLLAAYCGMDRPPRP